MTADRKDQGSGVMTGPERFARVANHLRQRAIAKHQEVDLWYEREIRAAEERLSRWHVERWKTPGSSLVSAPWKIAPVWATRALIVMRRTVRRLSRLVRTATSPALWLVRTATSLADVRVEKRTWGPRVVRPEPDD